MTRDLLLAVLLAAALLGVPAAQAGEREVRSITVDAAALDLAKPAGIEELSRRINRAVNRICGEDRICRDEAWESTEGQVAWAISHDQLTRQLAEERSEELMACARHGCPPSRPIRYVPSPAPVPGGVSVTIIHIAPSPRPAWRY